MVALATQFATELILQCMPFAIVFGLAGIAVRIFLKAAFTGRIEI